MTLPLLYRPLQASDALDIQRISQSSPWSFCHIPQNELSHIAATRPGVIIAEKQTGATIGYLLASSSIPPITWLGGFGVLWQYREQAMDILDRALEVWYRQLRQREVTTVHYSGYDSGNDWLLTPLLQRAYRHHSMLRSYDKIDAYCPTRGNQMVTVRAVNIDQDISALLRIEAGAFEPLWRHDAQEFCEIAASHPFFIVAEMQDAGIVGYQFSAIDEEIGFFIRIAVDARWNSHGIGARLMWEAVQFFTARRITTILLNTEENNSHAHRLYEWFGFQRVDPDGFVLAYDVR